MLDKKESHNTKKGKPGRFCFYLALGFGGGFLVFVILSIILLALCRFDLSREVPVPDLVKKVQVESAAFSTSEKNAGPHAAKANHATSASLAQSFPDWLPSIPDTPQIPEAVRRRRAELNAGFVKAWSELEAFRRDQCSFASFQEGYERWKRLQEVQMAAAEQLAKAWKESGVSFKDPEYRKMMPSWREFQSQIHTELDELCVRHGYWQVLGSNREFSGKWDEAVYYWRQAGWYGRWRIASGSLARRLAPHPRLEPLIRLLPYEGPERPRRFVMVEH